MAEIQLELVSGSFLICTDCLDGRGGECHTPGCVMYLCSAPDVAVRDTLLFHGCTIEEVTIAESDPPACGIPLAEHVPLSAGFTWRDHSPSGCGCAHPSGEGALWTGERHAAAPASPSPVAREALSDVLDEVDSTLGGMESTDENQEGAITDLRKRLSLARESAKESK